MAIAQSHLKVAIGIGRATHMTNTPTPTLNGW